MMEAVDSHPDDRRTHQAEVAARDDEIAQPARNFQRLVREQTMVPQRDAQPMIEVEDDEPDGKRLHSRLIEDFQSY